MANRTQLPKQKLIETAAQLVFRQGWNATGINQILNEADVPKGSFYYYFQSKDDLGVALIQHHGGLLEGTYRETLLNQNLNGFAAIESYFKFINERYRSEGWRWGSPVGSFCNEVADSTEKIAAACRDYFTHSRQAWTDTIDRGQKDGSIRNARPAGELAQVVTQLLQGSLLYMKSMRSEEPVRIFIDEVRRLLSSN